MKKVLFLIHDLGRGGAEKVLVNLVNNMDPAQFDITVTAIFGGGVNEQFLKSHIRYRTVFPRSFPGNSHLMKLLSPKRLHKLCVREHYDIEVSFLEGPCARIISGCTDRSTKLVSWIHCTMGSPDAFSVGCRSYAEAKACASRFHTTVFVSEDVRAAFENHCDIPDGVVLYNTNDSDSILSMGEKPLEEGFPEDKIKLIGVGKLEPVKGFDRLALIHKRLIAAGYPVHTYVLGEGSKEDELLDFLASEKITDSFHLLGYRTNPYPYVKNSDVFVCSSRSEGFSTAVTEALILGTPVCTVAVSGMKKLLGSSNEWGIVTENDEEALYQGIKRLLDDPQLLAHYKEKAAQRGKTFSTESTVKAVEEMLLRL